MYIGIHTPHKHIHATHIYAPIESVLCAFWNITDHSTTGDHGEFGEVVVCNLKLKVIELTSL